MENSEVTKKKYPTGGIIVVTLGVIFLINNFFPTINFDKLWPIILIIVGISMLLKNKK